MNNTDEQLNLWAAGKLPEAERQAFEQKMADDPALAREADFARALRKTMQEQPESPPGELGLARLQRAIREEQRETPKAMQRNTIWKPVAIAASIVVAVQAGLLLGPKPWNQNSGVDMTPASGEVASSGPVLQIVFEPSTTMRQIQSSVLSVQGSIAAGPSALGVVRLQLPKDSSAEEAVQRLRAYEFVEEVIAQ